MSIRKITLPEDFTQENFVDSAESADTNESIEPVDMIGSAKPIELMKSIRPANIKPVIDTVNIKESVKSEESGAIRETSELNEKKSDQQCDLALNISRIQTHKKRDLHLRRPAKVNTAKTTYERLSDLNLSQLVSKAKEFHVLPRERQMKINPTHRNWLIAQLRKANSEDQLHDLAFSLKNKELSLLFPVLATTSKPSTRDKLKTLILLRANKTLYFHGWLTWQFVYPDNRLAKTIAELCRILSEQRLPTQYTISDPLIKTQAEISFLPYPHFNWPEVKLISEVSMPDTKRFMSTVITYLLQNDIGLEKFFSEYAIYNDLAFGEAFKANYEIERIEYKFKVQNEKFSWQSFLGIGSEDNILE
ncbi:MAG TPA: hypothetical protein GXZ76_08245 [Clostridiaceae bacterium]|nr:hypothetical protein [Clostridiaceae bacterium]